MMVINDLKDQTSFRKISRITEKSLFRYYYKSTEIRIQRPDSSINIRIKSEPVDSQEGS